MTNDTTPSQTAEDSPNPKINAADNDLISKLNSSNNAKNNTQKIIKHGGVGFLTLLFFSSCATLGGAYLSLFILSRPDLVESLKIAPFLPKPKASLGELDLIQKEIAEIKSHIANESEVIAPNESEKLPLIQNNLDKSVTGNVPNNIANAPINPIQPADANKVAATEIALTLEPMKAQMAGLSGRLTAIETRLAALDPTGTGGAIIAALQAEIATLKVNVQDVQNKVSSAPSPAVTFAIISLAEAANRNSSFTPQFEAVHAALPFLPEVTALEPLSKTGAPNRALLSQEFDAMAQTIQDSVVKPKNEGGLVGWLRGLFSNLIKVEVTQNQDINDPKMVLERAKQKLVLDDLQGTIDELAKIKNPTPELNKWVIDAKNRMDLEGKIAALRGAIERGVNHAPPVAAQPLSITNVIKPQEVKQ